MATYRIEAPDGKEFEVEAPDDANESDVLARAQAGAQVYAQNDRTSREIANSPAAQANFRNPEVLARLRAQGADLSALPVQEDKALGPWASAVVRPLAIGLGGLPIMAMNAGVAARNLTEQGTRKFLPGVASMVDRVTGSGPGEPYEMPSEMFNRALDATTTAPETPLGKGAEFVSSVLSGGALGAPTAAARAPAGFVRPAANATQQVLREGRQAGYVAPPSSVPGSRALARTMEGLSGKAATAQVASTRNQEVTNRLARRAVGLADDAPLNRESLSAVRAQAGRVYEQIARSGDITADSQYVDDLAQLSRNSDEIARDFPELGAASSHEIRQLTDGLLKDRFSARSGMELLKELRKMASSNTTGAAAADPAKRALGYAQREAASAVEGLVARNLAARGNQQLTQAFNQARTTIARAHDVEGALNEATGNVAAQTVGRLAKKGKPLSGELEMIARFSRAFPKATQEVNQSFLGLSPLDYAVGGVGSLASGNLLPAAIPAARVGARAALMSGPMQRQAAGLPGRGVPPSAAMAAVPAMNFGFEDSPLEEQRRRAAALRGGR